jgi:hypothetical protein
VFNVNVQVSTIYHAHAFYDILHAFYGGLSTLTRVVTVAKEKKGEEKKEKEKKKKQNVVDEKEKEVEPATEVKEKKEIGNIDDELVWGQLSNSTKNLYQLMVADAWMIKSVINWIKNKFIIDQDSSKMIDVWINHSHPFIERYPWLEATSVKYKFKPWQVPIPFFYTLFLSEKHFLSDYTHALYIHPQTFDSYFFMIGV